MVDRELLAETERHLTSLWRQMSAARDARNWQRYWKLRRAWLSVGRSYSLLIEELDEESRAQLTLLPSEAGRVHDLDAG